MPNTILPLVVTPKPMTCESLRGFILRTSEMNGYTSPSDILRYCNMTENEIRSAKLPLKKLIKLYGYSLDHLKNLAYSKSGQKKYGKELLINGHSIPAYHTSIKQQKVCPQCINDDAHISSFWDIRYSEICPKHKCKPLLACPACNKELSWFRPGLTICRCGHDFSTAITNCIYDDGILSLMDIIFSKLYRKQLSSKHAFTLGFPIDYIDSISLRTFLGLIERFGNIANKNANNIQTLSIAAKALSNWPLGYYNFIENYGHNTKQKSEPKSSGLRTQFQKFYTPFFKTNLPKSEIKFLKNQFIEFANIYWKKGYIDSKLNNIDQHTPTTIGGVVDVANKIGVHINTVHTLVKEGIITPEFSVGKRHRLLFDLTKSMPKRIHNGKTISYRDAGKLLGLPVNVIKCLRKNGSFRTSYLGNKVKSLHEYDINFYMKLLLELGTYNHICQTNEVSLEAVMRMKLGSSDKKASIITALLSNQLATLRRFGSHPNEISLSKTEVFDFIKQSKSY